MRSRGWYRNEPGGCNRLERPAQFQAHLLRCIAEGAIAETEIRTIFPEVARTIDQLDSESTWQWRGLRSQSKADRAQILRQAAEAAIKDYSEGGSLADLDLIDGNE